MKILHIGDVVDAIEGGDENNQAYYLNQTGEIVWKQPEEGEKYISLPTKQERNDYHTMELFIESLDDPKAQDWLDNAIRGRGAFRRFRGACEKFHLLNDWYDFEYQSHVDLAIAWCEDHGIVYDMEVREDEEDEEEEDVSDFYKDDFHEEPEPVKEQVIHNPIHLITVTKDNMMNALYAVDGFRQEVNHESSDLDGAQMLLENELKEGYEVIAASDQGRIVGIDAVERTSQEKILRMLYVMKDMRHKGIGKMLLKHVYADGSAVICEVPNQAVSFFEKEHFAKKTFMAR